MAVSPGDGAAPIVDEFFIEPLRAAWGVGDWLRNLEISARELGASTVQAVSEGNSTKMLLETSARLAEFVQGERGALHRLLHRHLRQLRSDAPARIVADQSAQQLFEDARKALGLHPRILEIQGKLSNLNGRFGSIFPHLLADHVLGAGINEDAVANVRTVADVERLEQKIGRVTSLLQQDEDAVQNSPMRPELEGSEIDSDAGITMNELLAYRESAIRRRQSQGMATQTLSFSANLTAETAILILDAQAPSLPGSEIPVAAAVVEQLAVRAIGRWADGLAIDATDFMTGVLSASANGLLPDKERFVWRPPIGSLRQSIRDNKHHTIPPEIDASTFYSIPIGKDYVLFSRTLASVVRLYSRTLRITETVECTARPVGEVDTPFAGTVDFDLNRQFIGVDETFSHWYHTEKRVEIRVIGRCGDEWYGRIQKQGEVGHLSELGASDRSPEAAAFRILRPPALSATQENTAGTSEAKVVEQPRIFLGLKSTPVWTPFSEQRRALVRSFAGRSKKGLDAVKRESNMLGQLDNARKVQRLRGISSISPVGLVSLPRARGVGKIQLWPCYAVPLATWEPEYDRTWIQSDARNTFALLGSVARIVCAVHDFGFSVGAFGFQSFAIGVGWWTPNCNPRPQAVLASAPLACPIGERYFDPSDKDAPVERHKRMGVPLVGPKVDKGVKADLSVDANCFAIFAIDLLAKDPALGDHTYESAMAAAAHRDFSFTHPSIAKPLLDAIFAPDGEARVLRSMRVLADPKSRLNDWMSFLAT